MANNFKTLRQIVGHPALFIGKGWSWILRRPQSTLDVAGNDYATCSLSREIIQEAMPLILSNGKKRAKIFPTNIWKLREYKWFLVRSSNPEYIELSLDMPLQTQDISINIQFLMLLLNEKFASSWSCMCMFGVILCTFLIHSINFSYLFESVDPYLLKHH